MGIVQIIKLQMIFTMFLYYCMFFSTSMRFTSAFQKRGILATSKLARIPSARSSLPLFAKGFGNMKDPTDLLRMNTMPSIDQLAKQQNLNELVESYRNSDRQVFEDKLEFPTKFLIKIVGVNDDSFVADTMKTVASCLSQPEARESLTCSRKETSGGKYVSITVQPLFQTSDEIYAVYAALSTDDRVKFVV